MAMVIQRGEKKTWYAVFRDLNKKQRWVKLGVDSKKEAQKAADVLEDVANRKKSGQHLRAAFNELFQSFYGESFQSATARSFVARWLDQKKPEIASASYLAYKRTTDSFLQFLGPRADKDLAEITRNDVVGFRNEIAKTRDADTTNRYLKILRMMFKAAHRDRYVVVNGYARQEVAQ
jgi:hypothetical protein